MKLQKEKGLGGKCGIVLVLALIVVGALSAGAQGDFVPEGETWVIRNPSAWTRLRGEYAASVGVEPFIVRCEIGLLDYLTLGVSYGGVDVFGNDKPTMNPRPGFQGRFRITNGGPILPAIAFGYDDQGYGKYYDVDPYLARTQNRQVDYDRYQFKAKGFYLVFSQEIELLGALGLHAGVAYNVVETKDDDGPTGFASLEKALGPHLMLLAAYDAAFNDDAPASLGMGYGYLDAGIRWRLSENFNVEFWATNILENQTDKLEQEGTYARLLYLTYVGSF